MAVVLRCTTKLRKLLGTQTSAESLPTDEDWYANLLWIERRKCVLFAHSGTLFTFVVTDLLKRAIAPIGPLFVTSLRSELAAEALPSDTFGHLAANEVIVAKAVNRSVLGSMNDFAKACSWVVYRDGGLAHYSAPELNAFLRRTPMGAIDYAYPIEKTHERLGTRTV